MRTDAGRGETVLHGGVKIVGPVNLPASLPYHASEMYARNLFNLLKPALVKGDLAIDWNDEVVRRRGAHARRRHQARGDPQNGGGAGNDRRRHSALYFQCLAAFTGYEVISRVPVILHTPLMSGSNFVHGIVLVGRHGGVGRGRYHAAAGSSASSGVILAAGNAVGGYVVTERMLKMFVTAGRKKGP